MEASVRSIEKEGLVWGASTFVAIGYGVKKLQITLVITDDVSLDQIQEECAEFEDCKFYEIYTRGNGAETDWPVLHLSDVQSTGPFSTLITPDNPGPS